MEDWEIEMLDVSVVHMLDLEDASCRRIIDHAAVEVNFAAKGRG